MPVAPQTTIAALATTPSPAIKPIWDLHLGMSPDEVTKIMGPPQGNAGDSKSVIWIYYQGTVQFKNGKVILLSANEPG